ncbi:TlpA family protein disulfide reductase [Formosa maritima]|uniref:Thioredoxin domain-containing protein n=1 Tax=Formosa maritima TaxID=2592046 RepID=A0A5D0GHK3_9FLAO|nr:hypothetical protein [Formosa maritima]TYA57297.1 hypothetical protein FVF61_05165 [Formosa maritima]
MKYFYLILLFIVTLVSCKKDSKQDEGDIAYIGGEIINPSNNYVVLLKDNTVVDTITLDSKNRFIYKLDHLNSGVYKFYHGVEFQMLLLEPNDSIMLRLNTMEFDESLVFTGKGAKKNNYLINLYLNGEFEEETILEYSQLPVNEFEDKLDSIHAVKMDRLQKFNSKGTTSPFFQQLAQTKINQDYYLSKEIYPFWKYTQSERKNFESLPEDFYDYRDDLNYNDAFLLEYYRYSSFFKHHFENIALAEHFKQSTDSIFDRQSLNYNLIRLNLIDSLMSNEDIKNSLLVSSTMEFIINNKNVDQYDAVLNSFTQKSTNPDHKEYVSKLVTSLKGLKTGSRLPEVKVFDVYNNELNLRFVNNNQPSVIFFWSQSNLMHLQECHNKVKELKEKYPDVSFIGVNADNENKELWKKALKKYKLLDDQEYIFKFPKEAKQALAIYPINKVIIVDSKGLIENAHTNMFSINFEEELLGVLNQ